MLFADGIRVTTREGEVSPVICVEQNNECQEKTKQQYQCQVFQSQIRLIKDE